MRTIVSCLIFSALVVACSDGGSSDASSRNAEPSTSSPATSASRELCEAAETVGRLDDESQARVNELLAGVFKASTKAAREEAFERGWAEWKRFAEENQVQLNAAYDRLEAAVPADLKTDVRALADYSIDLTRKMSRFKTLEDLDNIDAIFQSPDTASVVQGLFEIDALTRRECNVTLAD